jgi:hypothetical protein
VEIQYCDVLMQNGSPNFMISDETLISTERKKRFKIKVTVSEGRENKTFFFKKCIGLILSMLPSCIDGVTLEIGFCYSLNLLIIPFTILVNS